MQRAHLARVPYVEQMQQTECGLCCLTMVLQYYRSRETLSQIREELDVGRDGLKLSQLYAYALSRNMFSKVFSSGVEGLKEMPLPAIVYWNQQHYIVLEKMGEKKITVVDPAVGRINMNYEEFAQGYSNVVMIMLPTEEFERKEEKQSVWGGILKQSVFKQKLFYKTALITLIAYGLQLFLSIVVQKIFDESVILKSISLLEKYLILATGVGITYGFMVYIRKWSQVKLEMEIDRFLTKKTFSKMMRLPYQYFERRTNGELLFRLNCLPVVRDLLSDNVMNGIIQAGFIIVILTYMVMQSVLLAVIAFCIFVLNGLFVMVMRKKIIEANQVQIVENTKLQSLQVETVQSIFNIKTAGMEQEFFTNWLSKYCKGMQAYQVKNKIFNVYSSMLSLFQILGPFLILWVGISLYNRNVLTIGAAIACYSLSSTFFGAGVSLFHMWNDFTIATLYLDRVEDILGAEEEKEDTNKSVISEVETVEFKNVTMAYSKNAPPVLKDINLKINQGEKIAIVGGSGSGKSTLIKLMLGLYEPSSGKILVNNMNMQQLNRTAMRKKMSIVPQDIYLFNKSILENIRMNNEKISIDKVKEAAKAAQIHEEIEQMPMKYHTVISNMGMNLSGGQRQRIALARAIVSNHSFIILDEATSSLDNLNERRVSRYFEKNNTTCVIVAHRLSTIEDADRIIVLENGSIVEDGSHDYLLDKNGIYARLYKNNKEENGEKNNEEK